MTSILVTAIQLESRSCTLQIGAKGNTGYLIVSEGELIAAETGSLAGKAAALNILTWDNVLIEINYNPTQVERHINIPLMQTTARVKKQECLRQRSELSPINSARSRLR